MQDWDERQEKEHQKVKAWAEKGLCIHCGAPLAKKMWESPHGGRTERLDCTQCPSTFFTHDYLRFRDVLMGKPGARLGG